MSRFSWIQVAFFAATTAQAQFKADCSPAVVEALLNDARPSAQLRCSLRLSKKQVLRKTLILEGSAASNTLIDCGGGTIEAQQGVKAIIIRSALYRGFEYDAPTDITIQNCRIKGGAVRIYGLGINGEAAEVRASSRFDQEHTARAQAAAPKRITFRNNVFTLADHQGVYVGPGTSEVSILNSEFKGKTSSTSVYLDTESARNLIQGNKFNAENTGREVIAVDGSAQNRILKNYFGGLAFGGIYLYRNCGEGGTIRIQTPRENLISGNSFYYNKFVGYRKEVVWKESFGIPYPSYEKVYYPSVYLGSRQGDRNYCDLDDGFDYGSSASDLDYADHNAVTNNKIRKLSTTLMIRNRGQGNSILKNKTVK